MTVSLLATAVEELFSKYSVAEIIIFIFLILLTAKEIFSLIDWFKNRGKENFKKDETAEKREAQVQEILKTQAQQSEDIKSMKDCIEMLVISDKNDIKAWITEKYHEVMSKGWVDDYELDCLEKRYADYRQEGGNSYIEDLMEDIRKLPKTSQKR